MPGEYSTNENKEDKYWFKKDNNYVYGINNYEKNNFSAKYYGVFIERIDDELYYYMPIEMHYDDMDFLNNEKTKSVIAFDAIMDTDTHNLRIWKKNHELIINYEIGDIYTDEKSHESIKMLSKTEKQITIDDLNMINAYFLCYENNFVRTFLNDLKTYKEKLEIRDAKLKEESDIIDTRVLIDMNPKDIFDLITNNKTECFQILIDEYNSMASDVDDIKPLKKKKLDYLFFFARKAINCGIS